MSNIKAFPLHEDQTETRDMEQRGMDLRDYFAAKAMQAILAEYGKSNWQTIAEYAYQIADAMLEARKS